MSERTRCGAAGSPGPQGGASPLGWSVPKRCVVLCAVCAWLKRVLGNGERAGVCGWAEIDEAAACRPLAGTTIPNLRPHAMEQASSSSSAIRGRKPGIQFPARRGAQAVGTAEESPLPAPRLRWKPTRSACLGPSSTVSTTAALRHLESPATAEPAGPSLEAEGPSRCRSSGVANASAGRSCASARWADARRAAAAAPRSRSCSPGQHSCKPGS